MKPSRFNYASAASYRGREARRRFERAGWVFSRQRGSHMILTKTGLAVNLSIPDHRELDRGLLRGLIRDAELTVEEFLALQR